MGRKSRTAMRGYATIAWGALGGLRLDACEIYSSRRTVRHFWQEHLNSG